MNKLIPDFIFKHVTEINMDFLKSKNIKGLIIDIDNTLAIHGMPEPDTGVVEWIEKLRQSGIKIVFVSNNCHERVSPFSEKFNCEFIAMAMKPKKKPYNECMEKLGLPHNEIAGIGDQIFTDVWGANRSDIISILVEPIDIKDILQIRIKRRFEKIFIDKYYKRNGIKND